MSMTKPTLGQKSAMIKLITFDLDNTLWDINPIIVKAEQQLKQWVAEHVPEAVAKLERDRLLGTYQRIREQYPEIAHHPSELRKKILYTIFSETNLIHEHASVLAEEAFAVFYRFRNDIELCHEAQEVLATLQQRYQLIALTNGNANLEMIGIDSFFSAHFSAESEGHPKPHAAMFIKALSYTGLNAEQTIHVGDHPLEDIEAARKLGFNTIWFNENKRQDSQRCNPDKEVHRLTELPAAVTAIAEHLEKSR